MPDETVDVLAIGAHPDDVEIQCAGTLALLKQRGHHITYLTMTPGDCGSAELGPLPPSWEEYVDKRSGNSFFLNHNMKTTTWEDPRPGAAASPVGVRRGSGTGCGMTRRDWFLVPIEETVE